MGEKCQIPECDEPVYDKGYCQKHAIEMEEWAYATYMDRLHEHPEEFVEDE